MSGSPTHLNNEGPEAGRRAFADVNVWIFDLDNTLYPPESALWPQVDQRITLFLGNMFGIDGMSARALQKYYYQKYGTTLKGLMDQYGMKPEPFLDFAHDIDVSKLPPDPELGHAIEALPGRKLILTNGSEAHARNVAGRLGIDKYQIDPSRAAMFEDLEKNLIVPHRLGMRTVLVLPKEYDIHREAEEQADSEASYIHFKTKDLTAFLRGIV